jgi:bacterioferritin-associated ferredoxin
LSRQYICRCLGITEAVLVEALSTGEIRTLKDIRRHTGAGDGCMACHSRLREVLERFAYASSGPICSAR